jgi:predicted acetyltransferase
VRQVELAEAGRSGAEVYRAAASTRAGWVDRPAWWWAVRHGLDGYDRVPDGKTPAYLVREGADGPDGFLAWRPVHDFDLAGNLATIEVSDLVAANEDAYRGLWAYLSGIDAVGEVTLADRPVDEPARWLLPDGRALRRTYSGDHVWLRLLDVPAALAARCYAVPGRLVLEVAGDPAGYANGRVALDGGPDGARCTPTDASPDLRLSHRALAGAYLGGYRLAEIAIGGGVDQLRPGAMATADAMFATGPAPWNPTGF